MLIVLNSSRPALANFTMAYTYFSQMGIACDVLCLNQFRAFGQHLAEGQFGFLAVVGANRIDNDADLFAPLQKPQRHSLDRTRGVSAHQNKIVRPDFAQQPFDSRFIKRVSGTVVQNNLVILPQHIERQIGAAVSGVADSFVAERVAYLFLSFCAVKTIVGYAAAIIIWVHLAGRDYSYVFVSGPRHNPSYIGQHPSVIPDARTSAA